MAGGMRFHLLQFSSLKTLPPAYFYLAAEGPGLLIFKKTPPNNKKAPKIVPLTLTMTKTMKGYFKISPSRSLIRPPPTPECQKLTQSQSSILS